MANFYDKASLVLIPSGTKEGTIFSQKPTNGDGDFTFSRASSATRVNSDGLIEKERGNTAEHSNTFNNWSNTVYASLTSGQTGYDGSSDAWLIEANSTIFCYIADTPTINTGIRTRSVYAKQGTSSNLTLLWNSYGNNVFASFDLSNGTFTNSNCLANIEDVGGGWYRCISTITNASNVYGCLISVSDENAGTIAIGDNIYIQDFQQEQGLVATDYIETTTSAVYGGITDNIPRLDYTDASCPSLLLEPQRTNLITHSEYLENAQFRAFSQILNTTDTTPEGSSNARVLAYNGGTNDHYLGYAPSVTNGETYTFSVFLKKKELRYVALIFLNDFAGQYFDLENGTILGTINGGPTNSKIEDVGNGWYRCSITDVATSTTKFSGVYLSENGTSYSGITPTNTDGVYIYGIQLEQGSYATSYIPTYGSAVTRNVDFANKTSASDLIGQTEGTLYLDLNITTIDSNSFLFGLYGGGNEIYFRGTTNNRINFVHYYGGFQANIVTPILSEGRHKLTACYKNNDWVLYLDGVLVNTDTSGSFVGGMNNVTFGYSAIGAYPPFESVNKAILFKTRLTNEELATLTTI